MRAINAPIATVVAEVATAFLSNFRSRCHAKIMGVMMRLGNYTGATNLGTPAITPPGNVIITSVECQDTNQLHLAGTGDANVTYTVQATTDLEQWLDAGDATADDGGAFEFVDAEAANYTARFYRVLLR